MEQLFNDIQYLKGVGPKRSGQLKRQGIENAFDLLWNVPRTYVNRANTCRISALKHNENVIIKGKVKSTGLNRSRRGMSVFKALVQDDSGLIAAVWFNQAYLNDIVKSGRDILLTGKVKEGYRGLEFYVSEYEILDEEQEDTAITPVYPLTEGLHQKLLRSLINTALQDFLPLYPEIIPHSWRERYGLVDIQSAFQQLHFPQGREPYLKARQRLAVEEMLLFFLQHRRSQLLTRQLYSGIIHREENNLVEQVTGNLPFTLTDAQKRVQAEIFADMEQSRPMNRLLQGDVGAGKTAIAALAMAKAVASGYQAVIMAPTEILASQHYQAMNRYFAGTGVVTALLTSSVTAGKRRSILEASQGESLNLLVGTHALLQEELVLSKLGLVIIDEQHRFGVNQRAKLGQKGNLPDMLVMTATPIPRTLALTVYGDLDLSVLDQLPPGRKTVKTRFCRQNLREQAYRAARRELDSGAQVYIVCPLVEESEKQDLQAAASLYEELRKGMLRDYPVGLLHGRLKASEKETVMQDFKRGRVKVLVTTTVIEVGVDVPDASVMIIEQAERFGLSQLHQLRGRVGRGPRQSYCFLLGNPRTDEARQRLQAMENSSDGFELAQRDLEIRGPGEFWGVKQHGLNQLKVATLENSRLIEFCRRLMDEMKLSLTPELEAYIKHKFKTQQSSAPN